MGGDRIVGEPHDYPYRHHPFADSWGPVLDSPTPRYWRSRDPILYESLARKRKLDGFQGEPISAAGQATVQDSMAKNSSNGTHSSPSSNSMRSSLNSLKPSARVSPGADQVKSSNSPARSEDRRSSKPGVISIPVISANEAEGNNNVKCTIVPDDGLKKSRKEMSPERASILVQSRFRGYAVRRTKPLAHLRCISSVKSRMRKLEKQILDDDFIEFARADFKARVKLTETIMNLLLELDAIQGAHPVVRGIRKSATKELIELQERVDLLLSGKSEMVEPTVEICPKQTFVQNDHEELLSSDYRDSAGAWEQSVPMPIDESQHQTDNVGFSETQGVESSNINEECGVDQMEDTCNPMEIHPRQTTGTDIISQSTPLLQGEMEHLNGTDVKSCNVCAPLDDDCNDMTTNSHELQRAASVDDEICHDLAGAQLQELKNAENYRSIGACEAEDLGSDSKIVGGEIWTDVRDKFSSEDDLEVSHDTIAQQRNPNVELEEINGLSRDLENLIRERLSTRSVDIVDCVNSPASCVTESLSGEESVHEENKCVIGVNDGERGTSEAHISEKSVIHNGNMPRKSEYVDSPDMLLKLMADNHISEKSASDDANVSRKVENVDDQAMLLKLRDENEALKALLINVMKWNQHQATVMKDVTSRLEKLENRKLLRSSRTSKTHKGRRRESRYSRWEL